MVNFYLKINNLDDCVSGYSSANGQGRIRIRMDIRRIQKDKIPTGYSELGGRSIRITGRNVLDQEKKKDKIYNSYPGGPGCSEIKLCLNMYNGGRE
jgi:hypothetical protein